MKPCNKRSEMYFVLCSVEIDSNLMIGEENRNGDCALRMIDRDVKVRKEKKKG